MSIDSGNPNDGAMVDELLKDKADFNWIIHTWSHLFLGCTVWQAQPLTSATASGSGGTFTAGAYSYEITAATAYGESEPSKETPVNVSSDGSVTLTWPEATNGSGTDGTPGPSLAQEEASHTGGTGFWGYNVYREDPGSSTYGLVGQVAENPSATSSTTYYLHRHGQGSRRSAGLGPRLPHRDQPGHRLRRRGGQLAAGLTAPTPTTPSTRRSASTRPGVPPTTCPTTPQPRS